MLIRKSSFQMAPKRRVNTRHSGTNTSDDTPLEALVANAVNTAIAGLVPNVLQQLQQMNHGGNHNGPPPGGNHDMPPPGNNVNPPVSIHQWLAHFQKQKPKSFSTSTTPVEVENWIAHIEKLFEVLGVDDVFKVRLTTYKLEDDAHRWWKVLKSSRGGDNYVATLSWDEFRSLFYQQYFTDADRSEYLREYSSIVQRNDEPIMEFKNRFCHLVGFLGPTAGTIEQQTNTFKWAICDPSIYRV
ncbi:putative retrotransposon gag domain-containing protein [Helianthus debilis subsp. tardiflorus]